MVLTSCGVAVASSTAHKSAPATGRGSGGEFSHESENAEQVDSKMLPRIDDWLDRCKRCAYFNRCLLAPFLRAFLSDENIIISLSPQSGALVSRRA